MTADEMRSFSNLSAEHIVDAIFTDCMDQILDRALNGQNTIYFQHDSLKGDGLTLRVFEKRLNEKGYNVLSSDKWRGSISIYW